MLQRVWWLVALASMLIASALANHAHLHRHRAANATASFPHLANSTVPKIHGNLTLEDAMRLVEQGQKAMAKANAAIVSEPQKNRYEVLDSTEITKVKEPAPYLDYTNTTSASLRRRYVNGTSTSTNSTRTQWRSYLVPPELAQAARIVAEASPPPPRAAQDDALLQEILGKLAQSSTSNAMPPVLQKPNGLFEAVREPASVFRFSGNDTINSTTPVLQQQTPAKPLAKRDETWWMASHKQTGSSPFAPPGYKVWRNVKDYGAKGDGKSDDTDAINRAISDGGRCGDQCGSSTIYPATVYFPPGTYLVSTPIIQYYNTEMIGDPLNIPTILAAGSFTGLGVITSDVYTGSETEWYINTNNFLRSVRNFAIDISATKSDAQVCGIHWQVAQGTSLENIVFVSSSNKDTTQQGIYMENGSGGFLSNLHFLGGKFGAYMGNQQFTGSGLSFYNVVKSAIQIHWDWGWTLQDLLFYGTETAITIVGGAGGLHSTGQGAGSLFVTDVSATNVKTLIATSLFADNSTSFVLQNTYLKNVDVAVVDVSRNQVLLPAEGNTYIDSWGFGRVSDADGNVSFVNGGKLVAPEREKTLVTTKILNGVSAQYFFTRRRPSYDKLNGNVVIDVKEWGARGDGVTNDGPALNYIFDAAANMSAIVYIPFGVYAVENTVTIPVGSRIIGQAWPQFMAQGPNFEDIYAPRPLIKVGEPGNQGVVEIQGVMFTVRGPTAGAILVEWNIHESSQGSAGLWDSHFRVGGAKGSNLQAEDCPKSQQGINSKCIAASMMMRITEKASAYLENIWMWTADHDMDKVTQDQITVYSARGVLIESKGPTWLWGTSSEHNVLYQYQLSGAEKVVMGLIQTESPYFQAMPAAPVPFQNQFGSFPQDPTFADCHDKDPSQCNMSWAVRLIDSSTVYFLSTGLYSWFQNYDRTCIDTENNNCQGRIFYTEQSTDIWVYNLITIGAVEMISPLNGKAMIAKDNRNGFASSIVAWLGGAKNTTGERQFQGYSLYIKQDFALVNGFSDQCKTALMEPILCHDYTSGFAIPKYHGPPPLDVNATDVCTKGCSDSIDRWVESVDQFCGNAKWNNGAGASYQGKYVQFGIQDSCQMDTKTKMNCNDVISKFSLVNTYKEMPKSELCSYCYLRKFEMMQKSAYSIYESTPYFQDGYKYAAATCELGQIDLQPQPPVIPEKPTPKPFCVTGTYLTKKGDTCNSIAQSHGVSSAMIFIGNPDIRDCNDVVPDVQVCLPPTCDTFYDNTTESVRCAELSSKTGLLSRELRDYNSWIDVECSNLVSVRGNFGNIICISPPGGVSSTTTNITNADPKYTEYTDKIVSPPPGSIVAPGTTLNCGRWKMAGQHETCASLATRFISAKLLRLVNPSLFGDDCASKIRAGYAYCIGPTLPSQDAITVTTTASSVPTSTPTPAWQAIGCYLDTYPSNSRTLTDLQFYDSSLTGQKCQQACQAKNFNLAGLENGEECWCGNSIQSPSHNLPAFGSSECKPCRASANESCGGPGHVFLYRLRDPKSPWWNKGCYLDTFPNHNRTLFEQYARSDTVTSTSCRSACELKGYTLAGVEHGEECWCGNEIQSPEFNTPTEMSECNMPCKGDNSENCGSSARISLWGY